MPGAAVSRVETQSASPFGVKVPKQEDLCLSRKTAGRESELSFSLVAAAAAVALFGFLWDWMVPT